MTDAALQRRVRAGPLGQQRHQTRPGEDMDARRLRAHAVPEFIEISVVEERDRFDDLVVPHLKIPGVAIAIGLAVFHRRFGIEQADDHIAVSEDAADSWNQRCSRPLLKNFAPSKKPDI